MYLCSNRRLSNQKQKQMTIKGQIKSLKRRLKILNIKIDITSGIDKGFLLSDKQTLINKIDKLNNLPIQSYLK